MGAALVLANQKGDYILTDRGTFLAQKENLPNLDILFGGETIEENPDSTLRNEYTVIPVNPEKHAGVNAEASREFVYWLLSDETQARIGHYGEDEFGQPLFYPSAEVGEDDEYGNGWEPVGAIGGVGIMGNMAEIVEIIMLTLKVSGTALGIACVLGIPAGVVLGLGEFRGKRLLRVLVYTGMGFPPVVVGLVVFLVFSNGGPLGWVEWLFTAKGMIAAQSILALPLAMGLTSAAVGEVPASLVLQGRSLGATAWQERGTIFWEARRGVAAAVLAALGRIISEVGAAMLVGGNIMGRTRVLSTAIVLETRQGNFGESLALGMVLLGIALLANVLTMRLAGSWPQ
ncbi:MAG: ABC transporter permease, partial [Anaerolineae bacterium]|nr:ABC transporter permease [Anaerolineae bacterium]